jgi:aspartate aminotransferase-like enzyme
LQLRIPGPTPLPPEVRAALAQDMIDHRGPRFAEIIRDVTARLKPWFGTTGDLLFLTASGTGALEAAVVNVLSPGDRVLAVTVGAFGDRFAEIARAFGADVVPLAFPWGQAADPSAVSKALEERGPFKAVLLTHNETSTGVTNDLAAIAAAVRPSGALLLVDAISSAGSVPVDADAWGLDLVLSGSQKGWMVPPGLAMVTVSPRAWEAYRAARMPRFYWDLGKAKEYFERGQTPATPAVSIFYAFQAALELLEREGMANVFARQRRIAEQVRAGVARLGLDLFADPVHASSTVTAVNAPPDLDLTRLLATLRSEGVVLAGGQGKLAGRIFRIGHLGYIEEGDVEAILTALRYALDAARKSGTRAPGA